MSELKEKDTTPALNKPNMNASPSPWGWRALKITGYTVLALGTLVGAGVATLFIPQVQEKAVMWASTHIDGLHIEHFQSQGTSWRLENLVYDAGEVHLRLDKAQWGVGWKLGQPGGLTLTGSMDGIWFEQKNEAQSTTNSPPLHPIALPCWVGVDLSIKQVAIKTPLIEVTLDEAHLQGKAKREATLQLSAQGLTLRPLEHQEGATSTVQSTHQTSWVKSLHEVALPSWRHDYVALPEVTLPLPFKKVHAYLDIENTTLKTDSKPLTLNNVSVLSTLTSRTVTGRGIVTWGKNTLQFGLKTQTAPYWEGDLQVNTTISDPQALFSQLDSQAPKGLRPVEGRLAIKVKEDEVHISTRGGLLLSEPSLAGLEPFFPTHEVFDSHTWPRFWHTTPDVVVLTHETTLENKAPLMLDMSMNRERLQAQGYWPQMTVPGFVINDGNLALRWEKQTATLALNGSMVVQKPFTTHWSPTPLAPLAWKIDASMSGHTLEHANAQINALGGMLTSQGSWNFKSGLGHLKVNLSNLHPYFDLKPKRERSNQVNGTLTLDGTLDAIRHRVHIQGMLLGAPLKMEGRGTLEGDWTQMDKPQWRWIHDKLFVTMAGNTISGQGVISPEKLEAQLSIEAPDISTLTLGFVPGLSGMMKGNVTLSGSLLQPQWDMNIHVPHLFIKDERTTLAPGDVKEGTTIEGLTLLSTGSVVDLAKQDLATHTRLNVEAINLDGTALAPLMVSVSGTSRTHAITLKASVPQSTVNLSMLGHWWPSHLVYQANVESLSVDNPHMPIRLEKPFEWAVLIQDEDVTVEPFKLVSESGSLELPKSLRLHDWGRQGEADIRLNKLDLSGLNPWLHQTLQLEGVASGMFTGSWGSQLKASGALDITPLKVKLYNATSPTGSTPLAFDRIRANLVANPDQLTTHLQVSAPWLEAKANLKVKDPQTHAAMEGAVDIDELNLATLNPWLAPNGTVNGTLIAHLEPKGDKTHPALFGSMTIDKLTLTNPDVTLPFKPSQIKMTFAGQTSTLSGVLKTEKGDVTLTGNASWENLEDPTVNVKVSNPPLPITLNQYGLVTVATDLTASANRDTLSVTGTVTVPQARLSIASIPSQAVSATDDLVLVNADWQPIEETHTKSPLTPQFDINIVVGDDVKFNAFDLKANLSGQLRVGSSSLGMTGNGQLQITQGQFKAYGQDLLIEDGRITFSGPIGSPFVNIRAIRNPEETQDGVIAGIDVTGPASKPKLSLFSIPAMNQSNALSYLLRGEGLGQGTGDDNLVTNALLGIGLSQTGELVQKIGQSIGLRDFHVNTRGAGENTQVVLSAQLLPHLEVKYGVGLFSALTDITLRYRLWHNFYVQAISSTQKEIGILYKFEF